MSESTRKCIECGGETHAIQIIDRGQKNIRYNLVYAPAESKRSVFNRHKGEGEIVGELCDNCGRITLRAASTE